LPAGAATGMPSPAACLVDNGQPLGAERVQVDLVAQADGERLHRAGGIIAAAVKAPVDQVLDPAAERGEGGSGSLAVAAATLAAGEFQTLALDGRPSYRRDGRRGARAVGPRPRPARVPGYVGGSALGGRTGRRLR